MPLTLEQRFHCVHSGENSGSLTNVRRPFQCCCSSVCYQPATRIFVLHFLQLIFLSLESCNFTLRHNNLDFYLSLWRFIRVSKSLYYSNILKILVIISMPLTHFLYSFIVKIMNHTITTVKHIN